MSETHISEALLSEAARLPFPGRPAAHEVIRSWLAGRIHAGQLPRGTRLPAERTLSTALGVSRMTLRQAMDGLEDAGYIDRVQGRSGGAFVAHPLPTVDISDLMGLSRQLLRTAGTASSRLLAAETVAAPPHVAKALELAPGEEAHRIRRIRFADDIPVVLEDSFFPAHRFPGLPERDLAGSLYRLMEQDYDLAPVSAREELRPVLVTRANAELLGIDPAVPMLEIYRTSWAAAGAPVEYSEDIFRTDRMRLTVAGRIREAVPVPSED